MLHSKGTIVIVDDDEDIRMALCMLLSNDGYHVLEASGPKTLASIVSRQKPNLVLLDMNFSRDTTSGTEGLEILPQLVQQGINSVLITAWGNIELAVKGMQLGATDFVEKPWDNQKLLQIVDQNINKAPSRRNGPKPTEPKPPAEWIAQSDAMQQLEAMVQQVADTQANVLILGENGTGKSLLAKRLHSLSSRQSNAFVSVNMAAIPDNLFESELFGHVKGAFTDAKENRQGRFELAEGGTLFLDEIGTLPASVQPKMLRVLESGEFESVGASSTATANVRIISATNADLSALVTKGEFRQDLLFRLNTFILNIPPLRHRLADIAPLSRSLIDTFAAKYNKPRLKLSNEAADLLKHYAWPGNVRELSHVIERAVILCREKEVLKTHIILSNMNKLTNREDEALRPLDDIELEMINKALKKYQGHISKAATALGISRNALYRRMEKHGIEKEDFDIE